ncbi:hypothetical protein O0L34_g11932 [Tuta absoluta]|nr:hypothetical protein O0L34_g11932 [Tuta absoluta]
MVEEITSIDFPFIPKESKEKYDGPTIDPDHSWTGYHRWESALFYRPLFYVWRQCLEYYGWYLLGALITTMYLYNKLHPVYYRWKRAREDAEYHKDPDRIRRNLESTQLAREIQQQLLFEESHQTVEADTQVSVLSI